MRDNLCLVLRTSLNKNRIWAGLLKPLLKVVLVLLLSIRLDVITSLAASTFDHFTRIPWGIFCFDSLKGAFRVNTFFTRLFSVLDQ